MARPVSIGIAASRLGTTARMLRYRESLGLLGASRGGRGAHRRYGERDLAAGALAARLEAQYDVSPAALAFAVRALVDPELTSRVRRLAEAAGHVPSRLAALDFEQEKGRRLLRLGPAADGPGADGPGADGPAADVPAADGSDPHSTADDRPAP